ASRVPRSLTGWRLTELHLVPFGVHYPAELAVLGLIDHLENVAAFLSQHPKESVEIVHPVVDHARRHARRIVLAMRGIDGPHGRSGDRRAFTVGPGERRAAPVLDIDTEVLLVPGPQRWSVLGLEEDAADAGDSLHMTLAFG